MIKFSLSNLTKWLPALLWGTIIFSFSLQNGEESGSLSLQLTEWLMRFLEKSGIEPRLETLHFLVRKSAHFVEYAILGILLIIPNSRKTWLIIVIIAIVAFGDELIQLFSEGRGASPWDSLLDLCGGLSGHFLSLAWMKTRKNARTKET